MSTPFWVERDLPNWPPLGSMGAMWSTQLFWKLFLPFAALLVIAVGVCLAFVSYRQEDQLYAQVEEQLQAAALLVADSLEPQWSEGSSEQLQAEVRHLGAVTRNRYTLVAVDGKVIADSEQETIDGVATMENHLDRKEFVAAKSAGKGTDIRESATLGITFLYYAVPAMEKGELLGYVRAARPVEAIQAEVGAIRQVLWIMGSFVGFTCLAVTYWLTTRIVQPLQALTEATAQVASGEYPQRLDIATEDEVGALARSFELMSQKLDSREKQLRENIQRQTTVLSGMIEGVIAVDRQQHVLFANIAAGRKLGFQPDEVVGWSLLEVVRNHELRGIVQRALQNREHCQGEIQWKTDVELTLEVTATPLPGSPCPGVVLVLHDVTDLKRLEGVRQQFISNVSHELKTPLSSIKAYTETLLSGAMEDTKHARTFLSRIDDQADRLHDLILDMLSLARIEAGQLNLEMSNVLLAGVVEQCVKTNEARAVAGDLTLSNEVSQSDLEVMADEESLLQILSNLVDNAIKYTPAGGTVTIRCRQDQEDAIIEVIDTGVGIAAKHLERLFERFYRVDKARSRELGGTGLGLSIVKHLSQAMGGSVAVESEPQQGSKFQVRLPLARVKSEVTTA